MGKLVHTCLGSSYLIAHVLHCPPPAPAHSFIIGPAVINTHMFLKEAFTDTASVDMAFEEVGDSEAGAAPGGSGRRPAPSTRSCSPLSSTTR
jgi:hypothetical protein